MSECKIYYFPGVKQPLRNNIEKELSEGLFLYSVPSDTSFGMRACGLCNAEGLALTCAEITPQVHVLEKYGLVIVQTVEARSNRFQLLDATTGKQLEGSFADYKKLGKWLLVKTVDTSMVCSALFNLKSRSTSFSILRPRKK